MTPCAQMVFSACTCACSFVLWQCWRCNWPRLHWHFWMVKGDTQWLEWSVSGLMSNNYNKLHPLVCLMLAWCSHIIMGLLFLIMTDVNITTLPLLLFPLCLNFFFLQFSVFKHWPYLQAFDPSRFWSVKQWVKHLGLACEIAFPSFHTLLRHLKIARWVF